MIDSLLPMVDDVGRVHTTFNQTIAATGRLSSSTRTCRTSRSGPPRAAGSGRRSSSAPGYESLMTADYSQIEMRIMAHLSDDAGLIEAFTSGEDLHTFVASRAFDIPTEQVDAEMRRRIKAMSYGLAYGLSAYGLAQQLKITPDEAKGQMHAYFERFGGRARLPGHRGRRGPADRLHRDHHGPAPLPARPDQRQPAAPRDGRADGAERADPGQRRRHHQGGDARRAARRSTRPAWPPGCCCRCTTSWCSRSPPGEREQVEELVRREMAGAAQLTVALEVSVGVGTNWDAAAH